MYISRNGYCWDAERKKTLENITVLLCMKIWTKRTRKRWDIPCGRALKLNTPSRCHLFIFLVLFCEFLQKSLIYKQTPLLSKLNISSANSHQMRKAFISIISAKWSIKFNSASSENIESGYNTKLSYVTKQIPTHVYFSFPVHTKRQ